MISDASEHFLRNMLFLLQREGYQTLVASSDNLLRDARIHQPHLILLEENRHPGVVVWQWLRKDPLTAHIPVIVTTNGASGDELSDGSIAFLSKPLETRILLSCIKRLLFPPLKKDDRVKLVGAKGLMRWEGKVHWADRESVVLACDNWRPEMDSLFQRDRECAIERIMADRAFLRQAGTLSEIRGDYLKILLNGAIERVQRRQFIRKPVELLVRYCFPGEFYRLTRTIDLSGGGARLADIPNTLRIGDLFEVNVILLGDHDKSINLRAELRWARPLDCLRQEAGISFLNITPEQRKKLLAFIFRS